MFTTVPSPPLKTTRSDGQKNASTTINQRPCRKDRQTFKTVFEWLKDYPAWWRESNGFTGDNFDAFCKEFDGDLCFEVFDGDELLALVIAEKKPDAHEIHLFCPRRERQVEKIVFDAREILRAHPEISDCAFILPALEIRVIAALEKAGAVRSGWRFVNPAGVTMEILIWNAKKN